ncbi:MAG: glycoside hydrolase family 25 protein [Oscillospiraceae bacterium]
MEVNNNRKLLRRRIIFFSAVGIFLIMAAVIIVLSVKLHKVTEEYQKDEEYIAVEASRVYEYFTPRDYVEMDDYTYGKIWLKALENVPRSDIDFSSLRQVGDFKYYTEDGIVTSKLGVDVSYFQQDIDWASVKEAGIDFAMIRVGYRGYESGVINEDKRFHEYMQGAAEAGIETGVYFYSQALTVSEAEAEAEFVISQLEGYNVTYPVAFDWEVTGEDTARTNDMSPADLTECTAAFCNKIARAGYIPMIYAPKRQALLKMDMDALAGFDLWLAEYSDEPEYPYIYQMWQYASDANVPGIKGDVDINISFVDYTKERVGTGTTNSGDASFAEE